LQLFEQVEQFCLLELLVVLEQLGQQE